jgi:hypothetical protein
MDIYEEDKYTEAEQTPESHKPTNMILKAL